MAKGPVAHGLGRAEALSDAGEYAAALEELRGRVRGRAAQRRRVHGPRMGAREPRSRAARRGAIRPTRPRSRSTPRRCGRRRGCRTCSGGWATAVRPTGSARRSSRKGRRRYEAEEDLWELVGWCELRLGRYQDAVATLREALRRDGRWIAVRFDLALALLCAGERSRAFLEYSRGVHQAVNGGVERLRGCLRVALDDLEESLDRAAGARDDARGDRGTRPPPVHPTGRLPSRLSG